MGGFSNRRQLRSTLGLMKNRFDFTRSDRIRKAMMREVSDIIRHCVKDPSLSDELVSVIDVEVSKDLRHAKIFVSIYGDEARQTEIMGILEQWTPQVRSELGKRIRLRYTPEILFRLDDALERGTRVTELINKISRGEL